MASHSPGPWIADINCPTASIIGHIIRTGDEVARPIASLWEGGGTKGKPTQIANTYLIAAAPDLLLALKDLVRCLEQHERLGHVKSDPRWDSARAAIAKAIGNTP